MKRFVLLASLASFALLAPTAQADPDHPTAAEQERAHELFERSKPLQDARRCDQAEKILLQAWSLQHSPDVAANLGMCQASMKKYRDAAEHLSFALHHIMAGATAEQRDKVGAALDLVEREVATVRLDVEPEGAEIRVDGVAIGQSPLAGDLFLDPGDHRVSVSRTGYDGRTETIAATKGERQPLAIRLERSIDAQPETTSPPPSERVPPAGDRVAGSSRGVPPKTVALVVEGAVAAVGLGVGVGFLLGRNSAVDERDRLRDELGTSGCSADPSSPACTDLRVANDRAERDGRLSAVGFVSAGVAALGFGATWLFWPEPSPDRPTVSVDPMRRTLTVSGRF
jgi:PEGA domain